MDRQFHLTPLFATHFSVDKLSMPRWRDCPQILLPSTLCEPSQPLYRLLCEQFGDVTLTSLPRHHFQSDAGQERVANLRLPSLASVTSALQNMSVTLTGHDNG